MTNLQNAVAKGQEKMRAEMRVEALDVAIKALECRSDRFADLALVSARVDGLRNEYRAAKTAVATAHVALVAACRQI